jgi:cytochrome P450
MLNSKTLYGSTRAFPPGPRGYPFVGVLPQMLRAPLETLTGVARQYGGVARLGSYRPGRHVFLVSHPEPLKHILQERYRSYNRGFAGTRAGLFLVDSMIIKEGDDWLQRRRLLQPVFHTKYILQLASTMADTIAAMLQRWQEPAARGQILNVAVEMNKLSCDITMKAMFGLDMVVGGKETAALERALEVTVESITLLSLVNPLPLWAPTPVNRAFRQAFRTFNRTVDRIIAERRRNSVEQNDLMALLMGMCDSDTGQKMNDEELRNEVRSLFFVGHETTATALTWTWYLLSQHPEVERRLHAEVDDVLGGRPPSTEDLPKLVYTSMVFMESIRLFPPGWLVSRAINAGEEDEIDSYLIPRNSLLFLSPYVTHRLPELWERPEVFNPERFTPEQVAKRPKFAYIPFGGGPRQCMGDKFAQLEAHLALAMIAQRYCLRLAPGTNVELEPAVTLHPRHGLPMTIQRRN